MKYQIENEIGSNLTGVTSNGNSIIYKEKKNTVILNERLVIYDVGLL